MNCTVPCCGLQGKRAAKRYTLVEGDFVYVKPLGSLFYIDEIHAAKPALHLYCRNWYLLRGVSVFG